MAKATTICPDCGKESGKAGHMMYRCSVALRKKKPKEGSVTGRKEPECHVTEDEGRHVTDADRRHRWAAEHRERVRVWNRENQRKRRMAKKKEP